MRARFVQDSFLDLIPAFVKQYMHFDPLRGYYDIFLVHDSALGICKGLTRIALACSYADESLKRSCVPLESKGSESKEPIAEDKTVTENIKWFQHTYEVFSKWDKKTALAPEDVASIKRLLGLAKVFYEDVDFAETLQVIQKQGFFKFEETFEVVREYPIVMGCLKKELVEKLKEVVVPGRRIEIESTDHSIGLIYHGDDHYELFDSNSGWQPLKDTRALADAIFSAFSFSSEYVSYKLTFNSYSSNYDKSCVCRPHDKVLKNLMIYRMSPSLLVEPLEKKMTLIHWAAIDCCLDSLLFYVRYPSREVDIDAKNSTGCSPLLFSVMRNHIAGARVLLEHGANPDTCDPDGDTVLHYAALNGNLKMVQLLIKHGASMTKRNASHLSPLAAASMTGHDNCAGFLKAAIAKQQADAARKATAKKAPAASCWSAFLSCCTGAAVSEAAVETVKYKKA